MTETYIPGQRRLHRLHARTAVSPPQESSNSVKQNWEAYLLRHCALSLDDFDAGFFQSLLDFGDVFAVAGFDGAEDVDAGEIGTGECSVVDDFGDVGSGVGENAGEVGEAAGAVTDQNIKTVDAPVGGEAALDDAAVGEGIDIAAGEQEDHFASCETGEMSAQEGSEAYGASAFDDAFFQFSEAEHGERDLLLLYLDHLLNEGAGNGEGVAPGLGDGESVGECVSSGKADRVCGGETGGETGCIGRFDTDDLEVGLERVQNRGHTGEQSTAADGDNDRFGIGNLLEDFKCKGALSGDDVRIIEGMDVSELRFLGESDRLGTSFLEGVSVQDDGGTELTAAGDFHQGSETRHDDRDGDAEQATVPCKAEGVVPSGCGDDSATGVFG